MIHLFKYATSGVRKLCRLFLHALEARNAGNNYPETYKQHEQSRIWLISGGEMFFDLKEPKRLSQVHINVGRGGLLYAAVLSITTRPDDPLALSGDVVGREVITSVGSTAVFDLLRTWYQNCCADHLECHPSIGSADETFQELPTRVIDVGIDPQAQLRLRESRRLRGQYAALTYCWGTSPAFMTRKESYESR